MEQNYIEICAKATGEDAAMAHEAAPGIRRVLAGAVPEFTLEYPCHAPAEQRWFSLTVTPSAAGARARATCRGSR